MLHPLPLLRWPCHRWSQGPCVWWSVQRDLRWRSCRRRSSWVCVAGPCQSLSGWPPQCWLCSLALLLKTKVIEEKKKKEKVFGFWFLHQRVIRLDRTSPCGERLDTSVDSSWGLTSSPTFPASRVVPRNSTYHTYLIIWTVSSAPHAILKPFRVHASRCLQ